MPVHRTLANLLLILSGMLMSGSLQADELKEIALQVQQGKEAAALVRLNTYLKTHPADAQAMFLKGVALSELNKRDEAIVAFTELTEKHPNLPEPYNNLAVLYASQGKYDKARQALEAALKTHPSYATAHNNLADVYAHLASEAYDKALQLDKGNARLNSSRLAMIDALPAATAPTMIASHESDAAMTPTRIAAVAKPETSAPTQPAKPQPATPPPTVTPIKLAEPTKPAPPAVAEKPAAAGKPAKAEPPESVKPVAAIKPAEPPAGKPATPTADSEKNIRDAVNGWALAWSSQNVEKYLASYAETFKTPNGESRKQWEATRRDRLTKPGAIKVDISNLRVIMDSSDQARAVFNQTYRAGSTVMRTSKTLVFRNAGGRWLIEQERTGS